MRVTICASTRFKEDIERIMQSFKDIGIEALFPNVDSGVSKDELTLDVMKRLVDEHFIAISQSDAIYVFNPEGYIGLSVAAEIGFAHGTRKPVYFAEKANDIGLNAMATDYIPITGLHSFLNV